MKRFWVMCLLFGLFLFQGNHYYLQVITEQEGARRVVDYIFVYPKTKKGFTKAEQEAIKQYINRPDAVASEHSIRWKRRK